VTAAELARTPVAVNVFCAADFFRGLSLPERVDRALGANVRAADARCPCAEVHSFRLFEEPAVSLAEVPPSELAAATYALGRLDRLSIHGPLRNALISRKAAKRERLAREYRFAIEQAAHFGASCVVVHFSPWSARTEESRLAGVTLLRELGDFALARGVRLGVENGGCTASVRGGGQSLEDFVELIASLDHPAVGATVDTGHLVGWLTAEQQARPAAAELYNNLLAQLLKELHAYGKLFHVHLNDVDPQTFGDHYGPGFGLVDFRRAFEPLCRSGYDGLLAIEMHRGSCAETGSLTPAEFECAVRYAQSCWAEAERAGGKG